jgi:hypothetical protein
MPLEKLNSTAANILNIWICHEFFFKEFALYRSILNVYHSETQDVIFTVISSKLHGSRIYK